MVVFSECIRSLDQFGRDVKLNIESQLAYRTFCGGITTLITICIMTAFFYNTFQAYFNKGKITNKSYNEWHQQSMFSNQTRYYNDDPPFISIETDNFMFAVQLQQTNFVSNPYYDIVFQQTINKRSSTGVTTQEKNIIQLEPCTLDHWSQLSKDYDWAKKYEQLNFKDWLCLPKTFILKLGGVYTSDEFFYYKISVNDCKDNPSIGKKCKTADEITNFLKANKDGVRIQLYQSNYIINPNAQNPDTQYLNDFATFLFTPGQMYVSGNLFYSQTTISTDDNIFIGENNKQLKIPTFSTGETSIWYTPAQKGVYSTFYLRKSMFQDVVFRKYQKIDSLISFIGGFAQSVFSVLALVVGFFNKIQFDVDLANKLYDFDSPQNNDDQDGDDKNKQKSNNKNVQNETKVEGCNKNNNDQLQKDIEDQTQKPDLPKSEMQIKENVIQRLQKLNSKSISQKLLQQKKQDINKNDQIADEENPLQGNLNNSPQQRDEIPDERKQSLFYIKDFEINNNNEKQQELNVDGTPKQQQSSTISTISSLNSDQLRAMSLQLIQQHLDQGKINNIDRYLSDNNIQICFKDAQIPYKTTPQKPFDFSSATYFQRLQFLISKLRDLFKKQKQISLSFQYFMNQIFFGKLFRSKNNDLINKAQQQIQKDMDIFQIILQLKELEKMKKIVLDKNQQVLFNVCPKPKLHLDDSYQVLSRSELQILGNCKGLSKLKSLRSKLNPSTPQEKTNIKNQSLQSANTPEMVTYKQLARAYDTILQQDSQLSKRTNQQLIQQLGNEIKEIFEESKKQ